jgi:hypothetical protein
VHQIQGASLSLKESNGNFGYLQKKSLHNCSSMFEKCSAVKKAKKGLVKTLKEEFKN